MIRKFILEVTKVDGLKITRKLLETYILIFHKRMHLNQTHPSASSNGAFDYYQGILLIFSICEYLLTGVVAVIQELNHGKLGMLNLKSISLLPHQGNLGI